jgi:pSer/pThr/pTyr-binding forkhead associated (FHA) protein
MSTGQLVEQDTGQAFPLESEPVTIGRDSDNTFILSDPQASRHHAEIVRQDGQWVILDLESANGTFVNEQQISGPQALDSGDTIRVGQTVLQVELIVSTSDQDTLVMKRSPSLGTPLRSGVPWFAVGLFTGAVVIFAAILFMALVVQPRNREKRNTVQPVVTPSATSQPPADGTPPETDLTAVAVTPTPTTTPLPPEPTATDTRPSPSPTPVTPTVPPTVPPPTITNTPAPKPSIGFFSAEQTELERGSCTRLEWGGIKNARNVALTDVGQVGSEGKIDVCLNATKTYVLEAVGAGGTVKERVRISVRVPTGPVIEYFRIIPSLISPDDCAQLEWGKVENATSAIINQGIGGVATPGSLEVCPDVTTVYVMTAQGESSAFTSEATLIVSDRASQKPVISFFTANPASLRVGECSMLSWGKVDYATEVTIDRGIGGVATPGSKEVCLGSATTYLMTAVGNGGTTEQSVTISVSPGQLANLPDLIVESILFEPNPCYSGQECTTRIKVRNDGPVGAGRFTLRWAPSGEEAVPVEWDIDYLGAGRVKDLQYSWIPDQANEGWRTRATVDAYEEVDEIEEGAANSLEQTITVLEPRALP